MKIINGLSEVEISEVKKLSKLGMMKGLMFCRREKAEALLFDKKNIKIHSLFVFFPFLAVWLDDKNEIICKKIVRPFKLFVPSGKSSFKLLEIPMNRKYSKIVKLLVGN